MADHLPPPDWRTRLSPAPVPPPVPASSGSGVLRGRGTVTSEQEAGWVRAAVGTRLLRTGVVLLGLGIVVASGALDRAASAAVGAAAPYLVLLVVLVVLVGSVPVLGLLRVLLGLGFLGVRRAGARGPTGAPGRQLTVATAHGEEEVLLAAARRIPAGSQVTVLGPRWFGCRHAWLVRYGAGRVVVARGVLSCLATLAVVGVLTVSVLASPSAPEPEPSGPVPANRSTP